MMIALPQSLDSLVTDVPRPTQTVHQVLSGAFAAARPTSVGLIALLVVSAVTTWYLARMPRDYPLRGLGLVLSFSVALVSGGFLGWRGWQLGAEELPAVRVHAHDAVAAVAAARPVEAFDTYLPLPAGASAPTLQPRVRSSESAVWDATLAIPADSALAFYRRAEHHPGWALEFDSRTMLVLSRRQSALGLTGAERLRIQVAAPGRDRPARGATRLEYVLTRRY